MLADISSVDAIYIVCGRTDMRKSIDGLCAIIQEQFSMEIDHALFLFCGRKCDRIKAILKEPDGIVMIYKRLTAQGSYRWPRNKSEVRNLTWREFDWLIAEELGITKPAVHYAMKGAFKKMRSAAVPRLYRIKFGRDIYKDLRQLEKSVGENDEDNSNLDLFSLEMFEDLAWLMTRHADPANVPDSPEEFLDQFNTFSIYQILPQLIELWGLNVQTEVESRKNLAKVSGK